MEQLLGLDTKWCGRHLIRLQEVDSTNEYLKKGDFPDGTAEIGRAHV